MKFTRERPSEDGYYFVFQPTESIGTNNQTRSYVEYWLRTYAEPDIVQVETEPSGERRVWSIGSDCDSPLDEEDSWWSEKITLPGLPPEEAATREEIRKRFHIKPVSSADVAKR